MIWKYADIAGICMMQRTAGYIVISHHLVVDVRSADLNKVKRVDVRSPRKSLFSQMPEGSDSAVAPFTGNSPRLGSPSLFARLRGVGRLLHWRHRICAFGNEQPQSALEEHAGRRVLLRKTVHNTLFHFPDQ